MTGETAPWWFAGTIGVVGVIVGLLLKWLIDSIAAHRLTRREDRLRFIQDKRVAYAELMAAASEVADAAYEERLLELANRALPDDAPDDDVDHYNARLASNNDRYAAAHSALLRAYAVVGLIGPESVVTAANRFCSRAHHPHQLARRVEAETEYVDAARADLGYPKTSHLGSWDYEPAIKADDPDSGVTQDQSEPTGIAES